MWTVSSEQAHGGFGLWFAFQSGGAAVSYAEVLRLWQSNDEFRSLFLNVLADAPYPEFRWETPPITIKTSQRPFEFVLLDSVSSFIRDPDPDSFADQFASAAPGEMAVEFPQPGQRRHPDRPLSARSASGLRSPGRIRAPGPRDPTVRVLVACRSGNGAATLGQAGLAQHGRRRGRVAARAARRPAEVLLLRAVSEAEVIRCASGPFRGRVRHGHYLRNASSSSSNSSSRLLNDSLEPYVPRRSLGSRKAWTHMWMPAAASTRHKVPNPPTT
jgi:hypothetical protein